MMQIRPMTISDIEAVATLWRACGLTRPWNDPDADIRFALAGPASTGLAGIMNGEIIAGLLVGHDGHRGSIYYVGVHSDHRGGGYGRQMMAAAEDWLRGQGVWKLNLLVRTGNDNVLKFYQALGFCDQENISLGKRLDGQPDRAAPEMTNRDQP
jgi:ribosomal protein S18 acetylase RimI-like enzyme